MKKLWDKFKTRFLTRQFLTFGVIGLCNTLISQLIYMAFVYGNTPVGIASILGDALSMVFSYVMNMRFTYHQKMNWKSAATFPLSYLPGIVISALMVIIVVDWANAPKIWAKLIALPIYVPINFLCMSFIVKKFGKSKQ